MIINPATIAIVKTVYELAMIVACGKIILEKPKDKDE